MYTISRAYIIELTAQFLTPSGMISFCLPFPCLSQRQKSGHDSPRHEDQLNRDSSLYDDPDVATQSLVGPVLIPPLPPPPAWGRPSPLTSLPVPERPVSPLPEVTLQHRPIPQVTHNHTSGEFYQPVPFLDLIPYPGPILQRDLIPLDQTFVERLNDHLERMAGLYGNYIRPEEIQYAIEAAVDFIINRLRNFDIPRFGGLNDIGLGSGDRRERELRFQELIRR